MLFSKTQLCMGWSKRSTYFEALFALGVAFSFHRMPARAGTRDMFWLGQSKRDHVAVARDLHAGLRTRIRPGVVAALKAHGTMCVK
jgi:hypothetical protein